MLETGGAMRETRKSCRILLTAEEYADVECIAAGRDLSVEEWISDRTRRALAEYYKQVERIDKVIEMSAQSQHPTADIEQMLAEIEAGYLAYDVC